MSKLTRDAIDFVAQTEEIVLQQSEYSQIRMQIYAPNGNKAKSFVSIVQWQQYLTREDREVGIDIRDEAPYRPTSKVMTFGIKDATKVANSIIQLKEEFLKGKNFKKGGDIREEIKIPTSWEIICSKIKRIKLTSLFR